VFAVVAVALIPRYQLGQMLHAKFYQRTATAKAAAAAAAHVPRGVVVETAGYYIGPHLDSRDTVEVWDGDGGSPVFPPWVIVYDKKVAYTWPSLSAQRRRIALLKARGYVTVFSDGGFAVMHAPGASHG